MTIPVPFCEAPLRFREDGTFRIVYISDLHDTLPSPDTRMMTGIERVLDTEKPDLVFLCGDLCNGPTMQTPEQFREYLSIITEPIVRRGLSFCHVCGNHDYRTCLTQKEQAEMIRSIPGCLTVITEDIPGTTNFVLPIRAHDSSDILAAVWGMDSGCIIDSLRSGLAESANLPETSSAAWDIIRFEQLMWYWNTSVALEKHVGHRVPGYMTFHIAPWEFDLMRTHDSVLQPTGIHWQPYCVGALNSGVFSTFVQRGDICCICCGHTHCNTCHAEYCGILMCSVGSAGYAGYGDNDHRACRVVDICADTPDKPITRTVYLADLQ